MRRMSPGWTTDLAILAMSGSTVDDHGDHLVIRSPANPDYHWGNCLLVVDDDAADDARRWSDAFSAAFPAARWLAVGLPRMPRDAAGWSVLGIDLEQDEVLTTTTVPPITPVPEGYTVRFLDGEDWELAVARELADNESAGGDDAVAHERFVRAAMRSRRHLCERGLAAFVGAFAGDALVADLGIVVCGSTARFQAVGTDAAHRRRGLASHLMGVAAAWAATEGCDEWVIVAEADGDAGRVYRRAGFGPADATVSAYRAPSPDGG